MKAVPEKIMNSKTRNSKTQIAHVCVANVTNLKFCRYFAKELILELLKHYHCILNSIFISGRIIWGSAAREKLCMPELGRNKD